jgi:hypothetical protein
MRVRDEDKAEMMRVGDEDKAEMMWVRDEWLGWLNLNTWNEKGQGCGNKWTEGVVSNGLNKY